MNDNSHNNRETGEKRENEDEIIEVDVEIPAEEDIPVEKLKNRIQQLESELEQAKKEATENLDLSKRIQASYDNYRKRIDKDRADYEFHVKKSLFTPILDVIESFTRALVSIETSMEKNQSSSAELLKGVKMISQQLEKVLDDQGIIPIQAIGKEFDPIKHDVVFIEEREDYEDNKVIEEFERGYILGSRVLRPAKVKVSKKKTVPPKEETKEPEEKKALEVKEQKKEEQQEQ